MSCHGSGARKAHGDTTIEKLWPAAAAAAEAQTENRPTSFHRLMNVTTSAGQQQ